MRTALLTHSFLPTLLILLLPLTNAQFIEQDALEFNCSKREQLLTSTCAAFRTMCRSLGGVSVSCHASGQDVFGGNLHLPTVQHEAILKPLPSIEPLSLAGSCYCHGRTALFHRDGEKCWILNDCGVPETTYGSTCTPDVAGTTCSEEEYTQCRLHAESPYTRCIEEHERAGTPEAMCECVPKYYDCLRQYAGCEEFIAQGACDDLVDSFIERGTDPAVCNYLNRCRCRDAGEALQATLWLVFVSLLTVVL